MSSVTVQVITYAPTIFLHCQHCELTFQQMGLGDRLRREEARDALPADLRAEFQSVSEWVHALVHRFGHLVRVKVVDAASIEGVWKSFRYRARRYPTVIVESRDRSPRKHMVTDLDSAEHVVERFVSAPSSGG
jgi:hypothetical protein